MDDRTDSAARLAFLEADNARLRHLLDAAGVSHGLRNTLAMLRAIVRHSAETAEDVPAFAAHLEGRLNTMTRTQTRTASDALGEVDLHTLVSDELLLHLVHEGERASIAGPSVHLRPNAAQVFALAVHELATNAVEHGLLGHARGRVDVAWEAVSAADADPVLTFVWKETGGAGLSKPLHRGFGTAVLEETLAYELHAHTVLDFRPEGLHCTFSLPLPERIGRLARAGPDDHPSISEPSVE